MGRVRAGMWTTVSAYLPMRSTCARVRPKNPRSLIVAHAASEEGSGGWLSCSDVADWLPGWREAVEQGCLGHVSVLEDSKPYLREPLVNGVQYALMCCATALSWHLCEGLKSVAMKRPSDARNSIALLM
ncbi:hypothetical protein BCR34DRAFT_570984, partial [Clohesyomyces aquaticus]